MLLGVQKPGDVTLPLHAMANNTASLKRFGMHFAKPGTTERIALDVAPFLEQYCAEDRLLEKLQDMVGPGQWVIYQIALDKDGAVLAEIGLVLPRAFSGAEFTIKCDGVPIEDVIYANEPHFGHSHWFMPHDCVLRISGRFPIRKHGDFISFTLHFDKAVPPKIAKAYRPVECYLNMELLDDLPDLARIQRVAGNTANAISFLNGGRNASKRILQIASDYGMKLGKRQKVLDWGVGCGKVALHMAQHSKLDITGIDIDEDNVGWCAKNLKGRYVKTGLMPPSPLRAETFDISYSCSVLSHLTERVVDAWLEELGRVMKSDGLAIHSFNGSTNLATYLGNDPSNSRKFWVLKCLWVTSITTWTVLSLHLTITAHPLRKISGGRKNSNSISRL